MAVIWKSGLTATDVEVWRLRYADSLMHWHHHFCANIKKARVLYNGRFCRMSCNCLIASVWTFRLNDQVVFQFQLAQRPNSVPLPRDCLYPTN